ncbi:MAG TPA: putative peptidoglycan glycosyltransferase FtsW [Tenuifilaceae bacterium]|nr:putative peptidoglycan glycosyltransferase FtsW [Tenuifilaceae bacterium]HPE17613.1 putative peptidoglycan glycosyltransferase FtsW [Tenuifilaceae bacterium]HPJ44984.1 putative peptidoglycan glycosyltransferase FtsW [Tenuifilaceae bacterium]HPQ33769.1 putative peptidoglycan glycosyltransferase FtsW [Tenuifilaceae bacterium]HRX67660.1 putative peptidoglycan glycosyltransferase FtsW [Tenuifilaceae bacterium]
MESVFGKYFKGDRVIWLIVILLSVVSLLAVYSSTGSLAYRYQGGNTAYYFLKQLGFLVAGLMVVFFTHLIPYKVYSLLSQVMLYIAIPLQLITLVFGTSLNQASRWLAIPGLGITIQTSDFAKLALILYVARFLSLKQGEVNDFKKTFVPLVIPVGIVCLLILPANFSTAALLGAICWLMMFVGRINLRYLLGLTGIGAIAVGLFIFIALQTNTVNRVQTWKNRIENFASGEDGSNYQAEQSKIAIATGGLVGKGPGKSTQRNFLPHPYSDFIYSIIVEEYGLVGGIFVLFFYSVLLFRAGYIVRKSQRTFPAFLTIGLTLMIVFQAFINMGVAVNLIPVTGQPLPLVSMGGTSLLFSSVSFGILLSISRSQNKAELFEGEELPKGDY